MDKRIYLSFSRMGKPVKVTLLTQYIIDHVRIRRLENGISKRELSLKISNSESLVGNVENPNDSHKYSGEQLEMLANELGCSIEDFFPKEFLPDDTLHPKTEILVDKKMGPSAMLNSLLEKGYFEKERTLNEITDYCNYLSETNRKTTDFSSTIARLLDKKKLRKIEDPETGGVSYRQQ